MDQIVASKIRHQGNGGTNRVIRYPLMCANILSLSLMQAEQQKEIQGIKVGKNGCSFTHLLFADDSLLFFRQDNKSLGNIQRIIDWYRALSGQSVNLAKFDLYCSPNMPRVDQETLAIFLKVNLVQNPTKYLGLNFKLRGRRVADFNFLVDKLNQNFKDGRQSCFHKLEKPPTSTLSFNPYPCTPSLVFEYLRIFATKWMLLPRNFWWGHDQGVRKMHLINWNKICHPKSAGSLGFKKFSLMNQAMLAKQFWRIHHNPHSLVAKTFKAKYFPRSSILDCTPKPHQSWFWRNIIKHDNKKLRECRWWVGNGSNIPLSHPAWYSSRNLHNPNLTTGTVADLIDQNTSS